MTSTGQTATSVRIKNVSIIFEYCYSVSSLYDKTNPLFFVDNSNQIALVSYKLKPYISKSNLNYYMLYKKTGKADYPKANNYLTISQNYKQAIHKGRVRTLFYLKLSNFQILQFINF